MLSSPCTSCLMKDTLSPATTKCHRSITGEKTGGGITRHIWINGISMFFQNSLKVELQRCTKCRPYLYGCAVNWYSAPHISMVLKGNSKTCLIPAGIRNIYRCGQRRRCRKPKSHPLLFWGRWATSFPFCTNECVSSSSEMYIKGCFLIRWWWRVPH